MAVRHHTLSWSIASLHGDEQAVRTADHYRAHRAARTRLFGATGTVLMAIGALGAGARPVVQDPTFGVRMPQSAVTNPNGVVDHDHDRGRS